MGHPQIHRNPRRHRRSLLARSCAPCAAPGALPFLGEGGLFHELPRLIELVGDVFDVGLHHLIEGCAPAGRVADMQDDSKVGLHVSDSAAAAASEQHGVALGPWRKVRHFAVGRTVSVPGIFTDVSGGERFHPCPRLIRVAKAPERSSWSCAPGGRAEVLSRAPVADPIAHRGGPARRVHSAPGREATIRCKAACASSLKQFG